MSYREKWYLFHANQYAIAILFYVELKHYPHRVPCIWVFQLCLSNTKYRAGDQRGKKCECGSKRERHPLWKRGSRLPQANRGDFSNHPNILFFEYSKSFFATQKLFHDARIFFLDNNVH